MLERGARRAACRRTAAAFADPLRRWSVLWTFLRHPEVARTNDDAKRALRPRMRECKISRPARYRRGDEFIVRGSSLAGTRHRQGREALDDRHQAVIVRIAEVTAPPVLRPAAPAPAG